MSAFAGIVVGRLEDLCQRLDRADALIVRQAIDEIKDLAHELETTDELLSGVTIAPGPNFGSDPHDQ